MGGNGHKKTERGDLDVKPMRPTEEQRVDVRRGIVSDALQRVLAEIEREAGEGVVYQVMGPVVDVAFKGQMPALRNLLRIDDRIGGLPLEAVQLLGKGLVRCVALEGTDGLRRGQHVYDTYEPISVPVGPEIKGRMLNVLGEPIDESGPVAGFKRMSIHQPPMAYAKVRSYP